MLEDFGVINLWTYVMGAIFIVLVPGPNSIFVLTTSVRKGVKEGYKAASAVVIGDSTLVFLSYLGVASLIRTSPTLFLVIKYLGAAYLIYLGIKVLYNTLSKKNESSTQMPKIQGEHTFRKALILSLTNPKAILFYVSFFVQFIDPAYMHSGLPFLILGAILEFINIVYLTVLIFSGATLATIFREKKGLAKFSNSFVGMLFMGFGFTLATINS